MPRKKLPACRPKLRAGHEKHLAGREKDAPETLSLFDRLDEGDRASGLPHAPAAASVRGSLGAVPPPRPDDVALAARVPSHVFLGTSSWTFPGWADFVYRRHYPSQKAFVRSSLEEYVAHPLLRTVGIDRSFYGPLPREELASYAALLPDGYRVTMKVWDELASLSYPEHARFGARAGQPNPRFLDVAAFAEHVALPVEETFRAHLAAYVIEVPPTSHAPDVARFEERLDAFLVEAAPFGPFAIELRDTRLMTDRYLEILATRGASHCFSFWSRMPGLARQRERIVATLGRSVLGPVVVARLMLPHGKGYDAQKAAFEPFDRIVTPQPVMRRDVVALADACGEAGLPLYVVVNNKAEGSAPRTVEALARLLAERGDGANSP
ncbi:MAG: DUF72 domain-containing protein [Sandaracinaceae bacterium]|nr:DUF72 domain-containing protein [Sandaracinaceae bacterium]